MSTPPRLGWTLAVTSSAWFVFALDRLAVVTALPSIRTDLGADLAGTAWTVNAYTLSFAVLLLAGAALGDRFGRRRMFAIGMTVFTVGSAVAAQAPTIDVLVAARALQGVGGAVFAPLSLTMLSAAAPPERRGAVLGTWGGIGGVGAAVGPLFGGGLSEAAGWQWTFLVNVPLGLLLVPLALLRLPESHGPHRHLDLPGVALSGVGLLGIVWALIRMGSAGGDRIDVVAGLGLGALALAGFVAWELRAPDPMLPMRFFRSRTFAAANLTALLMYAALFGALFLVSQLLQAGLGAAPLEAGVRMLPMAAMPMLLTPLAGALSDRLGSRPLMIAGVALVAAGSAGLAAVTSPDVSYLTLIAPMVLLGGGSALFFAPIAATVLGAVAPQEQGKACGATTTIRELAVALGVAVLTTVFAGHGDLGTPAGVVAGVVPALWLAAALATAGVLSAITLPPAGRSGSAAAAPTQERNDMPEHPQPAVPTRLATPRIRAARPDDHPAIRDILRTAYGQYSEDIPAELWCPYLTDLLDLDQHARHGHLVVAEVGGKIAGYAAFYPDATTQGAGWPAGWAGGRGLAVHPAYRKHGVAGALLTDLERRARADGAAAFAFHTSAFMTAAVALYERLGYSRVPQYDLDVATLYGVQTARPWPALAYLRCLDAHRSRALLSSGAGHHEAACTAHRFRAPA